MGGGVARRLRCGSAAPAQCDPDIVLTASDIGSFVFCQAAWHNQRLGANRTASSLLNLERGTLAHRRIAKRATTIRSVERARLLVLLMLVALAVAMVVRLLSVGSIPRP